MGIIWGFCVLLRSLWTLVRHSVVLARCPCDKSDLRQSPPPSLVLCNRMVRCIEPQPLCSWKANTPTSKWGSQVSRTFPLCFLGIWAAGNAVETLQIHSFPGQSSVFCPIYLTASSEYLHVTAFCPRRAHRIKLGWTHVSKLSCEKFSSSKVPINTVLRHLGLHRAGTPQ